MTNKDLKEMQLQTSEWVFANKEHQLVSPKQTQQHEQKMKKVCLTPHVIIFGIQLINYWYFSDTNFKLFYHDLMLNSKLNINKKLKLLSS